MKRLYIHKDKWNTSEIQDLVMTPHLSGGRGLSDGYFVFVEADPVVTSADTTDNNLRAGHGKPGCEQDSVDAASAAAYAKCPSPPNQYAERLK